MGIVRGTLGHYEVLGPIGAGGMGEVFAARDTHLGRKVAIKVLPERLAGDRETLSRFTQEARSASALNHPNIVTIHEVGTDEGTPFIVMEYIDGRDLRTTLGEGPMSVRTILDIATQIADGLAAAHERGIVHRDLKPENIMLTRDGYVKILDFGLAKVVNLASDVGNENTLEMELPGTNPGTILGTVGYMSPEQATGKRIDFRSDQFALGAILHELSTRRPAFEGETAIDTLSAILHVVPDLVTRLNPKVPPQLADIVRRLLSKSPDDRYASPRDLAKELRLLRDRVSAEESGFHVRSSVGSSPRKVLLSVLLALALAAFLAGLIYVARQRTATPTPSNASAVNAPTQYLAVLRFQDLTGDQNGQLVVDGFAETLTARLSHFRTVQIMRPPATADAANPDPRKIAKDVGANLVLTGSMMRNGNRVRVTYRVLEPASGREWRDLIEGSTEDLFGVQDDVAESVARNLSLGDAPARPQLDPAISQRRYLEAIGQLRRYDSDEAITAAIDILTALGPSPSVQAALSRAYLYRFQNTKQPQFAALAGAAAERALEADPQSIDVNITLGDVRRQTGRYKEAVDAFLRVLSQQPNNADAVLGLAETYKASGDVSNAETSYKRAIALQPNFWGGYNKLGAFYYSQGRYNDAIPQFEKVTKLVPDSDRGFNNLGGMYQRLGRYDEAVRVFEESIRRKPTGQGYSNLGTCYYFVQRYPDAAAAFEKAVQLVPHNFVYRRNLGDAYRWVSGNETRAKRTFEETLELCNEATRVNPSDARARMTAASALAKLGRRKEARAEIIRALELDPKYASAAYEAAVIANLAGADEEVAARLEQALRLGFSPDDMLRDPEFSELKKNGRLQAIINASRSTM